MSVKRVTEMGMGAWTPYTPVCSQGVSTNISKTATFHYKRQGMVIHVEGTVTFSGTGTAGSAITTTLPVPAAMGNYASINGGGRYYDNAQNNYIVTVELNSSTEFRLLQSGWDCVGQSPSIAVASGDAIYIGFSYRAAG